MLLALRRLAHVRDGKLWKFEGNPRDPPSRGRLCPRGTGAVGALYDPDRLRQPLIRVGERGKEQWKRSPGTRRSRYVAERMNRSRPSTAPSRWRCSTTASASASSQHVLKSWGAINFAGPSFAQCRGPRDVGFALTFGTGLGSPEPTDIANTDCLVLIGTHLGENMHNTQVQEFAQAIERRVPIIVVDPRFSVAASKAKYWLPIKPGTDLALLLAWANVLVTEGRYDREFVAKHGHGFDKFAAAIKDCTPEWAAKETGVDAELIRAAAREFASAPAGHARPSRPARQLVRRRHAAKPRDGAAQRAARKLGAEGRALRADGMKVAAVPAARISEVATSRSPTTRRREVSVRRRGGHHRHPRGDPHRQALSDQGLVRLLDQPDAWRCPTRPRRSKAIETLDLLVVVDTMPSEIAGYADVVLPETTFLERHDELLVGYGPPRLDVAAPARGARRRTTRSPAGGSRSSWPASSAFPSACPSRTSSSTSATASRKSGLSWDELTREGVILGEPEPITVEEGARARPSTRRRGKVEFWSDQLRRRASTRCRSTRRPRAARRAPAADHRARAGAHVQPHADQSAARRT